MWLKQSTATTVPIGPLVDDTDGKTAETAVSIVQATVRLSKNGGSFAQKSASGTQSHMENGWYALSLSTTDTNTLGTLTIAVAGSGALPVFRTCMVLPAGVWDALFGAGTLDVNVSSMSNNVVTNAAIASNAIANAQLATGAITADTIAANSIGASELASDAVTEIQSGLATSAQIGTNGANLTGVPWNSAWDAEVQSEVQDAIEANHLDHLLAADYDPASKPGVSTALLNELVESDGGVSRFTANALEQAPTGGGGGGGLDAAGVRAAVGLASANLDTQIGTLATASELTTLTNRVGTPSNLGGGATVAANLADIESQTDDIGAAGAGLTGLPWNAAWDAEVQSEAADALNAYDPPTNTEMIARTRPTAEYATATNLQTVDDVVDGIATALMTVDDLVDTLIAELTGSRAEPAPGAPAADATLGEKVDWFYATMRNKQTVGAGVQTIYADDGSTPLTKATVADTGTFTRGEMSAP